METETHTNNTDSKSLVTYMKDLFELGIVYIPVHYNFYDYILVFKLLV